MGYHSGKEGKVRIGSTDLCVVDWELDEEAEEIDVTNTCSGGDEEFIGGTVRTTGTCTAIWDDTALPNANPPNVNAGQTVTAQFFLGSSGKKFSGSFFIRRVRYRSQVKGRVEYSFEGKFTGTVTKPS